MEKSMISHCDLSADVRNPYLQLYTKSQWAMIQWVDRVHSESGVVEGVVEGSARSTQSSRTLHGRMYTAYPYQRERQWSMEGSVPQPGPGML